MANEEYNKDFLQADSLEGAKNQLQEVYEANPDAVIIVEEEGKECIIEHGKQLNFVPSDVDLHELKENQKQYYTKDEINQLLAAFPKVSENMKTDGKVYALVNGEYEEVAPAENDLLYDNTVVSATLQALDEGRIPVGLTEAQLEQVKANIPADIWDELGRVPATLEMNDAKMSDEQLIEAAVAAYRRRKAEQTDMLMPTLERGSLDVEPKNTKNI